MKLREHGPVDAQVNKQIVAKLLKPYSKIIDQLQIFGYVGTMKNSSGETHSLGSLRFQLEGRRKVAIVSVTSIVDYLQNAAEPRVMNCSVAAVSQFVKTSMRLLLAC